MYLLNFVKDNNGNKSLDTFTSTNFYYKVVMFTKRIISFNVHT